MTAGFDSRDGYNIPNLNREPGQHASGRKTGFIPRQKGWERQGSNTLTVLYTRIIPTSPRDCDGLKRYLNHSHYEGGDKDRGYNTEKPGPQAMIVWGGNVWLFWSWQESDDGLRYFPADGDQPTHHGLLD